MASPGIKHLLLVLLIVAIFPSVPSAHLLQEGDLLFACSESPNAITRVTSGVEGLPIDHVAIVHRIGGDDGPLYVIEAIKPSVCLTPIDTFLCRNGQVIVGRLNTDWDMPRSVRRCLLMVGKPYDDLYLPGDSALYCSELVQMNYVSLAGEPVFNTIPMSFHDESGDVIDYWIEFYRQRCMSVPEGEPGSNPGELSRRPQVTIIGKYPSFL
ncbi:MAG: hypothetical protein IJV05_08940 [Muribaculaceae bacterium]|nr:hypothetical protein [Muribaculaceae bacterium]